MGRCRVVVALATCLYVALFSTAPAAMVAASDFIEPPAAATTTAAGGDASGDGDDGLSLLQELADDLAAEVVRQQEATALLLAAVAQQREIVAWQKETMELQGIDISRATRDLQGLTRDHEALVVSLTKRRFESRARRRDAAEQLEGLDTLAAALIGSGGAGDGGGGGGVVDVPPQETPPPDGGRALVGVDSECSGGSSGPRLLVNGVCSCAAGLVVGGRSVLEELDVLNAEVELRLNLSKV
jgi:hypothetical protein